MKRSRKGVTVVEYAVMLALVAIAVLVAVPNVSSAVVNVFSKTASFLNAGSSPPPQSSN